MSSRSTILVTGGAGFIGSSLVRLLLSETDAHIVNLDLLTYAGLRESLAGVADDPRHEFVHGDIGDAQLVGALLDRCVPRAVIHLAAETHVDRSIDDPEVFVRTNLLGTGTLLRCCLGYWEALPARERDAFRFVHASTDEVFGPLALGAAPFTEASPYQPSSPYAASKAGSDHLVQAYWRTYGLPTLVTNSSNNYGPRQLPEKLIPLVITRAAAGESLPIYGDGQQVRDWLYVEDQSRALLAALQCGAPGESYVIGAECELTNLEVVSRIGAKVDRQLKDREPGETQKLITHVADRLGHDRRYAIDAAKARAELGWAPQVNFDAGLRDTVAWYLEHTAWVATARSRLKQRQRVGPDQSPAVD